MSNPRAFLPNKGSEAGSDGEEDVDQMSQFKKDVASFKEMMTKWGARNPNHFLSCTTKNQEQQVLLEMSYPSSSSLFRVKVWSFV